LGAENHKIVMRGKSGDDSYKNQSRINWLGMTRNIEYDYFF
jgi:hypothetical protein